MKLCNLSSGSNGNCTYIEASKTSVLVDIGISGKRAIEALAEINISPFDINAIFITHEHLDHIKGAGIFSRKFNTPIYATRKTWDIILEKNLIGKVSSDNIKIVERSNPVFMNELTIKAFEISHDAVDPVGYIFNNGEKKIGYLTDCGAVDKGIKNELSNCDGIVLEFNHDPNMLQIGRYPYYLKRRIASDIGHLSNDDAANLLAHLYHKKLKWAVLAHISNENNIPELAYLSAKNILESNNINIKLYIAQQKKLSPILIA
ncbi:MBL fold metallo-hydrolase [Candidatus Epulonipiscioides gigas]|nr:MBL fold metallo-hydrolase [Epulopiscium sp. SCG-C07WGA-EpuloA2]